LKNIKPVKIYQKTIGKLYKDCTAHQCFNQMYLLLLFDFQLVREYSTVGVD